MTLSETRAQWRANTLDGAPNSLYRERMASGGGRNGFSLIPVAMNGLISLRRHVATWDFRGTRDDELTLTRGDILLVAEKFDDGWVRGIRMSDLGVGFFPKDFVAEDTSPIYTLKDIVPLPGVYRKEYDSCRRSKIALEICTSEESYFKKLDTLDKNFAGPLSRNGIITSEECSTLFRHIKVLLNLSHCLLVHLRSRMEGWDERITLIGDIFLDLGHHMKVFISYAVHHLVGAQLILKLNKQEKFRTWLAAEDENKRTLNALQIEPIQRIPRYELLLKELLKHTAVDHPDTLLLREALAFVQKIAQDCNESVRKGENELKLYSITRRFPWDEVNVIVSRIKTTIKETGRLGSVGGIRDSFRKRKKPPCDNRGRESTLTFRTFFEREHKRMFVKEGPLMKNFTDPSERFLFLCSDVLLIAKSTSRSQKRFRLRERVLLRHAWVTDTLTFTADSSSLPDRGFILGTPCKVYRFLASSSEEKREWFGLLHSHIFTQKKLFHKLLTHLSIPDERYFCARAKARTHHIGTLKDELSFMAGDEVWVMGFGGERGEKWKPGLYATQQPFDPSPEWYMGSQKNGSFGWFPVQCLFRADSKPPEPSTEELKPAIMSVVLGLKQRMIELTGQQVAPLTEAERDVKVCIGEGNFKTLRIPSQGRVEDVVRKYFRSQSERLRIQHWTLVEQSLDESFQRLLEADEDPGEVVDFWGKSKDQMRFVLKQTLVTNNHTSSHLLALVS